MMKAPITWLLQKNLTHQKKLQKIKAALSSQHVAYIEMEIAPFSNHIPKYYRTGDFNIVYGSTSFMLSAYEAPHLKQGVFFDNDLFSMENYVLQWGNNMLNHDGRLTTLEALRQIQSDEDQTWFIRPNLDSKTFNGQLGTFGQLKEWSQKIIDLDLPDFNKKTKIWMAPPKQILKEWRLFIVDDKIASACRYMLLGTLNESLEDIPDPMIQFSKKCIQQYRLHDIYVMDIAETDNGYHLIECNCFNGTGFYQHDIHAVLLAINNFIQKREFNFLP